MNKLLDYNCFLNEYVKVINFLNEKYTIFQNPKPTDPLNENIRFVSDKFGNIYCLNRKTQEFTYSGLIHKLIVELLQENNIDVINPYSNDGYNNTISWQRYMNTNRIYLGESYHVEEIPKLNMNIIKKCVEKNSNWNFYFTKIFNATDYEDKDEPYKINI
jgi:hypothetical protein